MRKLFGMLILLMLCSCAGGKYNYLFDTGKELDFSKGQWLLNKTKSNSRIFDNELYDVSLKNFSKILGDSLVEMNMLRTKKPVPPTIDFELSNTQLKELHEITGCGFLINVSGNIISNGAGTFSFYNGDGYYNASNLQFPF